MVLTFQTFERDIMSIKDVGHLFYFAASTCINMDIYTYIIHNNLITLITKINWFA